MQDEFNPNQQQKRLDVANRIESHTKHDFALTEEEREAIEQEKHHYEDARAASIEALKIVQKSAVGWKMVLFMRLPLC